MQDEKYIILYSDEFQTDIWKSYMNILGLSCNETKVKIIVKNVLINY